MRKIILLFAAVTYSHFCFSQWQQTNGPSGTVVNCLTQDGGYIFAGTSNKGIFISNNNGMSWTSLGEGLNSYLIKSIAVEGNNIFVGTNGQGVLFSPDNGSSWQVKDSGLIYSQSNPDNLIISSIKINGDSIFIGTASGLFFSNNNCTTMTPIDSGLSSPYITPEIYSLGIIGTYIFAGTQQGLFLSTNGGISWHIINVNSQVASLAVNGDNVIIGTAWGGIFSSPNKGTTWDTIGRFNGASINSLATIGSNIFAGTNNGIVLSSNNGATWEQIDSGLTVTSVNSLVASNSCILAATGMGIFSSCDSGSSWSSVNNGFPIFPQINSLAVSGTNIFAGNNYDGLFLSTNNGEGWSAIDSGLTDFRITGLAVVGNNIFASTESYIFLSTNNGVSWKETTNGLANGGNKGFNTIVASGGNVYVISCGTLYISSDTGKSWTLSTGAPSTCIFTLAVSGSNIFAGDYGGEIYLSTDTGISWSKAYGVSYPGESGIFSLLVIGNNVFAGTNHFGLYMSSNNGSSWVKVDTQLILDASIFSLAASGNNIYAGTNNGMFLSTDNGMSWTNVKGPIGDSILSLLLVGNNLFAGTDVDGVWKYIPGYNPCHAGFSLYPDSLTPHIWYAINQTTGVPPITYLWNWGDGNISSGATPSHTYSSAGMYNICLSITDSIGCTSSYCDSAYVYRTEGGGTPVTVNVILPGTGLGIKDLTTENNILVYPNPAGSDITISISGNERIKQIEITNIIGQVVSRYNVGSGNSNYIQIQLPQASGLYFIHLKGENGDYVRKVVKE